MFVYYRKVLLVVVKPATSTACYLYQLQFIPNWQVEKWETATWKSAILQTEWKSKI